MAAAADSNCELLIYELGETICFGMWLTAPWLSIFHHSCFLVETQLFLFILQHVVLKVVLLDKKYAYRDASLFA